VKSDVSGQIIIAISILTLMSKLLWMFGALDGIGERVITLLKTTVSGVVIEMLVVCVLFMSGSFVSFVALLDKKRLGYVVVNLYRGVIFGDGASLNRLGLDPYPDDGDLPLEPFTYPKLILSVVATFFFNIVILNLIIAVYGNEYDRLESISSLHFWRQRARSATRLYLTQEIWKHERLKWICEIKHLFLVSISVMGLGVFLCVGVDFIVWCMSLTALHKAINDKFEKHNIHQLSTFFCGTILAVGELLLFAWTRTGNLLDFDVDDEETVVEKNGKDKAGVKKKKGKHGPGVETEAKDEIGAKKEKFLWICLRSDFTDNYKGRDNASRKDLTDDCCSKVNVEKAKKDIKNKINLAMGAGEDTVEQHIDSLIADVRRINEYLKTLS